MEVDFSLNAYELKRIFPNLRIKAAEDFEIRCISTKKEKDALFKSLSKARYYFARGPLNPKGKMLPFVAYYKNEPVGVAILELYPNNKLVLRAVEVSTEYQAEVRLTPKGYVRLKKGAGIGTALVFFLYPLALYLGVDCIWIYVPTASIMYIAEGNLGWKFGQRVSLEKLMGEHYTSSYTHPKVYPIPLKGIPAPMEKVGGIDERYLKELMESKKGKV